MRRPEWWWLQRHRAAALLLGGLLGLGAQAQPADATTTTALAPAAAVVPLTLAELVQLTLLHNAATQAARLQVGAAGKLLQAEAALYEPLATGRWRREGSDRPRTYEERTSGLTNIGKTSAIEQMLSATAGVRGKLPSGATFEMAHDMRRRQSNLLASDTERENRGTLTLSIRQPLLRNAGRNATEADLQVSALELQIERQRFVKQLVDSVGEAAGTYWQLVRADAQLALRDQGLASARQLHAETQRRVQGGIAPRIDQLEADIALGAREADRLRALQLVDEAEVRIRNLLNQPGSPGQGQRYQALQTLPALDLAPGDGAAAASAPSSEPTAATLDRLLAQWPGYQIARLRAEQEQLRFEHAVNQQQPDISVELGYNQNSLTQRVRQGISDSLRDLHPGWYVGVSVEVPLGNAGPRSRREAQALKRDAARVLMESEARSFGNEWATRSSQQQLARRELQLLQQEVQRREGLWLAEQSNHQLGRSRLRQLLETEDRLTDARSRLIEAAVRAQLAELALQALTGELFSRFGVRVDG